MNIITVIKSLEPFEIFIIVAPMVLILVGFYLAGESIELTRILELPKDYAILVLLIQIPCLLVYIAVRIFCFLVELVLRDIPVYLYLRLFCKKARKRNAKYWKKLYANIKLGARRIYNEGK